MPKIPNISAVLYKQIYTPTHKMCGMWSRFILTKMVKLLKERWDMHTYIFKASEMVENVWWAEEKKNSKKNATGIFWLDASLDGVCKSTYYICIRWSKRWMNFGWIHDVNLRDRERKKNTEKERNRHRAVVSKQSSVYQRTAECIWWRSLMQWLFVILVHICYHSKLRAC